MEIPAALPDYDRTLPQVGVPEPVAEELIGSGLATRGGRQEFGSFSPGELVPVMVAVAGLAGSVVTLITQSDDALRRLAESLARWRRTAKPETGKTFSLLVRRGKQRVVAIELDQEPDPDVLLAFLRSALGRPEGDG